MRLSNNYSIQEFKGQKQEQEQQTKPKKVNGFIPKCGAAIASALPIVLAEQYGSSIIIPSLKKYSNLPDDVVEKVHTAAKEAIKTEGLDKHGVSIKLLPKLKKKPSMDVILKNPILQVNAGLNSMFLGQDLNTIDELGHNISYKKNTIFLPKKKSCLTVFHEMGHAANFNKSKITKALLFSNVFGQRLAFLPLLFGVFTRKSKPDENGNLTTGQKIKNFVRDNAGKLTFACFVPTLLEEGLASIRAHNYAKKGLSPDILKKVSKTNIFAYSTYVVMALATAFAAKLGVSVKDEMIANKEAKAAEKMNAEKA